MKDQVKIDHIVYVTKTLKPTVRVLEDKLGVKFEEGGKHPGFGTKNYLLSLGTDCYLEVIGEDQDRLEGTEPTIFGVDQATTPRVATFAIKSNRIEEEVQQAENSGLMLGPVFSGAREKTDGSILKWKLSNPMLMKENGLIPFLIDWGNGPHPCDSLPFSPYTVSTIMMFHPDPKTLQVELVKIDVKFTIEKNQEKILKVILLGPEGLLQL